MRLLSIFILGLVTLLTACHKLPTVPHLDDPAIVASSTYGGEPRKPLKYAAWNLIDNNTKTVWCEGAKNRGQNEKVQIALKKPIAFQALHIVNGFARDRRVLQRNGQIKTMRVRTYFTEDKAVAGKLDSVRQFKPKGDVVSEVVQLKRTQMKGKTARATKYNLKKEHIGNVVELTFQKIYRPQKGKDKDTCMAEIRFSKGGKEKPMVVKGSDRRKAAEAILVEKAVDPITKKFRGKRASMPAHRGSNSEYFCESGKFVHYTSDNTGYYLETGTWQSFKGNQIKTVSTEYLKKANGSPEWDTSPISPPEVEIRKVSDILNEALDNELKPIDRDFCSE